MRPILLTMQAFGPYAERTQVDFRTCARQPLFGVYGPTGGGKTTIMDAVTFALFGESSGNERSPEQLRSDYADAKCETFVELVFALGEKRFYLRRLPAQELAKKRGEGTTARKHEAHLFDVSKVAVDDISFPVEVGRVVAERKVGEVDSAIESLLGYTAEQFRQVIMLPQGQFRKLLTAKSDDRSKILRRLFDTSFYQRLTDSLKARHAELRRELDATQKVMQAILSGQNMENAEALAQAIAVREQEVVRLTAEVEEVEEQLATSEKALTNAQALAEKFSEREAAEKALAILQAREVEMKNPQAELEAALLAEKVRPASDMLTEAEAGFAEARADQTVQQQRLAEADKQHMSALQRFEAVQEKAQKLPDLQRHLQDLERYAQRWTALAEKRETLTGYEDNFKAAELALTHAAAKHEETQSLEKSAREALAKLGSVREKAAKLAHEVEGHERDVKNLEELARFETRHDEHLAVQKSAESALAAAVKKAAQATRKLEKLDAAYLSQTVHRLAGRLTSDAPCPVCGSSDHPAPALEVKGARVTEEALEAARRVSQEHAEKQQEKYRQVQTLTVEIASLAMRIEDFRADTPNEKNLDDVRARLSLRRSELEDARSFVEAGPKQEKTLDAAASAFVQAARSLETARENHARQKERLSVIRAELATALSDIPKDCRDGDRLERALADTRANIETLERAGKKAAEDLQSASKLLESAKALAGQADGAVKKHKRRAAEKKQKLLDACEAQGFESIEAFEKAMHAQEDIETLKIFIELWQEELKAVGERVKRAKKSTAKATPPDIEKLSDSHDKLKTRDQSLRKQKATIQEGARHLKNAQAQYAEQSALQGEKEQAFGHTAMLAEVADGRGANSLRTSLVDWLLAAYFEDVLAHANLRFEKMSRGRYRLQRKFEPASGRQRAGLDIAVFDAHTGEVRDAVTLSGGESFLAALALALGLSDVVQEISGGVRLDTIFIDEGFGNLDDEALGQALDALIELGGSNRTVGIISHVEEVKRMVPAGFDVTPGFRGARVKPRSC